MVSPPVDALSLLARGRDSVWRLTRVRTVLRECYTEVAKRQLAAGALHCLEAIHNLTKSLAVDELHGRPG